MTQFWTNNLVPCHQNDYIHLVVLEDYSPEDCNYTSMFWPKRGCTIWLGCHSSILTTSLQSKKLLGDSCVFLRKSFVGLFRVLSICSEFAFHFRTCSNHSCSSSERTWRCEEVGDPASQHGDDPHLVSGCRKKGVAFKGGSLHDGFGGFDGFWRPCSLLLLVLQNTGPRGNRDDFDGFGGFGGYGGFGHDGYPPL